MNGMRLKQCAMKRKVKEYAKGRNGNTIAHISNGTCKVVIVYSEKTENDNNYNQPLKTEL